MRLAANEVHLWQFSRPAGDASAGEMGADEFLRDVLARYAGGDASTLSVTRGARGKPRLAGASELRFNLSHSGERVIVGISAGGEIGLDLERVDLDSPRLDGLIRFCTAAEQSHLLRESEAVRRRTLARLWTAKEAILKATGEGVTKRLEQIEVLPILAGKPVRLRRPLVGEERDRDWIVVPLDFGTDYAGAFAVEAGDVPLVLVRNWPVDAG